MNHKPVSFRPQPRRDARRKSLISEATKMKLKEAGTEEESGTVPFLESGTFHCTGRKVFGQRRLRYTLWVPSGSMDAPNDR